MPLFPLYYLPPLAWFSAVARHQAIQLDVASHYVKQHFFNRCLILTAQGSLALSIPVQRRGSKESLQEKRISNDTPWQRIHWRSIQTAYRNAPYFEHYAHYFAPHFEKRYEFLKDFNLELLAVCFRILKISPELDFTTDFVAYENKPEDFRARFDQNIPEFYKAVPYTQTFGEFVPNLSILDLIMNAGTRAGEKWGKWEFDTQNNLHASSN